MTTQTLELQAVTDDEALTALAEVSEEELKEAAGRNAPVLSRYEPDPFKQVY